MIDQRNQPCSICKKTPTALCRERLPGSKGHNRNSFSGHYRLCVDCVAACSSAKAIETCREAIMDSTGHNVKHERMFTMRAKTHGWLENLRDYVWLEKRPPAF